MCASIATSGHLLIDASWIHLVISREQAGSGIARRVAMSKADELQARAEAFADESIRFIDGLPKGLIAQRMAGQLLDASTSVAANYRAARRGRSHAEFTAKIGIVSEESDECVYWLMRLKKAHIASAVPLEPLLAEAIELSKIFAASARTARGRRKRQRPSDPPPG